MDETYLIANFHDICRLCLCKNSLMVSIFANVSEDEDNLSPSNKIADCFEQKADHDDGLPTQICYKCLFKLNKCHKFKIQCSESENRLRQVSSLVKTQLDSQNHDRNRLPSYGKNEYMEDSVVVVDPTLEYNSEDSDDKDQSNKITKDGKLFDTDCMQESSLKNVFMCQYCDQAFVSQHKCTEHEITTHDPKLPFGCVECSLVFAERSQYIQHTKQVHQNDKPYHCPECEKSFGRRSDLRKHSIVHTGVRPFQCHYCLKAFSRNTNLGKHLRLHTGQQPHVCPSCRRSFVAKEYLQKHMLVHSSNKPYPCTKCSITFTRKDKLAKHELKHMTDDNNFTQESHDMVVSVNPFSSMIVSTQIMETTELSDLPCVPDHISGESSFINHVQKTSLRSFKQNTQKAKVSPKNKPKNIKCHQCPKRFSSLDAYKTHVSIAHIGSRGFQCKVCFKKFSRRRELDRHMNQHSQKSFPCKQCDKICSSEKDLIQHETSQECLVVNMPCIECGVKFERKAELVAHIKSHFSDEHDQRGSSPPSEENKSDELESSLVNSMYGIIGT